MTQRERVEQVYKTLGLSARQFAEQIHVRPGTISNMMAGRNNPSLDVMRRIMERYPTLNPEWLILGVGEMWRTAPGKEAELFDNQPPEGMKTYRQTAATKEEPQTAAAPPKQIKNIVVYYTDGTYEEFKSSNLPL